ncbi:MAG: N-acetyltransferase family protein [Acidimicrobiaceae bacterium]|nr:N-acetyltransferase family protein [Acidimicrobiaceae bacterium]MYB86358.1 N-acetyltransferase family protein [Acidimicrobiaceae bacterium]
MDEVVVRLATLDDAEEIRRIYNYEVEHTTHTFDLVPRTLEDQQAWLQERAGALGVLVAELGGRVVGFSSLSEYRPRAAYRTSVESSVYVDETVRGRGVGRRLMQELVGLAQARGFHTMIARIAGGHQASVQLHEAVGFTTVGTEQEVGRKFGGWLDVVVMQRMLVADETPPRA